MARNEYVINIFRVFSVFLTFLGVALATGARFRRGSLNNLITFMGILVPTVVGGGFISLQYIRLLKWVLTHLHVSEDQKWVTAVGINAICDVILVRHHLTSDILVSIICMILICVVAAGWDRDESGMTEGLLIGFGKLSLVHLIIHRLSSAAACGAVLLFAIVSKVLFVVNAFK